MNPSGKDLTVSRMLEASRSAIWKAWKTPELFVKWFAPAPVVTVSNKHEFHAGGGFDTTMHLPDGTIMEGGEGCFLEVVEMERIVFTDALRGGWRPNKEAFFSAVIVLEERPKGTMYTATALHGSDEDCQRHAQMGFADGWGRSIEQLGEIAASLD